MPTGAALDGREHQPSSNAAYGSGGSAGGGAGNGPEYGGPSDPRRRRKRGLRITATVVVLLLVLLIAWPVGLMIWANGKIQHIDALSDMADSSATTYLLAGSDSRERSDLKDPTKGQRSDTIMLLTAPKSGTPSLISLPRDTYVEIPGYGHNKLNAAYSFGGPKLLVKTVEQLTGIKIDNYVEIGMGGVTDIVDAVGGVKLCLDYDVNDRDSQLKWKAGCHKADGKTALAFARMRHADPLGDIGRNQRQQQVIKAVSKKVATPAIVAKPWDQVQVIDAGLSALQVSEGTNIFNLGKMALTFRNVMNSGVHGAPPIADMGYAPGGIGSTVLLDKDKAPAFFKAVADGTITKDDFQKL